MTKERKAMEAEFDTSSDVIFILVGMPDTSKASPDLPAAATIREEPPAKSPLAVVDGIDIPPELPAIKDEESNVAAEG